MKTIMVTALAVCSLIGPASYASETHSDNSISTDKSNRRSAARYRNRHRNNHNRNRNYDRARNYRRNTHSPYRDIRRHNARWRNRHDYYRSVPRNHYYRNRWIRPRVTFGNGYYWHNNYPWFVFNGYSHRYSNTDYCNYEMVDSRTNEVIDMFSGTCNYAYDRCADERDEWNDYEYENRYFCAEAGN